MRRAKLLCLLSCYLLGGLSSAWAWPHIELEASEHQSWRDERMQDKRRAEREYRDERQERFQRRREDADADRHERLSPEERRELRRQIRRANQD